METVLSLIKKSTTFFDEKGIGEPKLSAEHLLSHALGVKRLQMYLRFDQPIQEQELESFRDMVRRRLRHEPVQYIVGSTEFYGLEFAVSPAVLIPRPETEHLIDALLDLRKEARLKAEPRVLDIGTGSGAIAVALAKQLPDIHVTATDVSQDALNVAEANASRNGVTDLLQFLHHDILTDHVNGLGAPFDIVVSNPPYIPKDDVASLQPEVRDHEPLPATTDGADGLRFYRRFAELVPELLAPGGLLAVEIGYGQASTVRGIFADAGLRDMSVRQDYAGIDRVVTAWR
ncbi:MAG: peptide chain release factor N(5)-glutamine methyltransferase [Bacteroidetes bacterium]|nr:peptide chain release factor N(5)-glutamine methyltransferase [Bacteroidota bacterium]